MEKLILPQFDVAKGGSTVSPIKFKLISQPLTTSRAMLLRLYGEDIPLQHPPEKSNQPDTPVLEDDSMEVDDSAPDLRDG